MNTENYLSDYYENYLIGRRCLMVKPHFFSYGDRTNNVKNCNH